MQTNAEGKQDHLTIVGYADQISVEPGQKLNFMISTTSSAYTAGIVRLIGGMTDPDSQELESEPIISEISGAYPGRLQKTSAGSYAELPLPSDWLDHGQFTVHLWAWPTKPASGHRQTIWSAGSMNGRAGAELYLDMDGHLTFTLTDKNMETIQVSSENPLHARAWYEIVTQYSAQTEALSLLVTRCDGWTAADENQLVKVNARLDFSDVIAARVLLAAAPNENDQLHQHYNGKIENPSFFRTVFDSTSLKELSAGADPMMIAGDMLVAHYDFGTKISSSQLVDRSKNGYHGILHQGPTRAVTSHLWNGEHLEFTSAPKHYAAVHFHDDDIADAGWEVDISWQVPNHLQSGVYALQLMADDKTDYIPFFVRPTLSAATSPVLFLAPTNTYLAYANERLFELGLEPLMGHELKLSSQDRYLIDHPELGKSIYDTHSDGSGVHYSSRLRPIMNIRPHYRNWLNGAVRHLAADLYITGWLEKRAEGYDVATDEDLHRDGLELLSCYKVLVTGTHPEYWTRSMMETLQEYLANGGRLMYLGANGFYWVTSIDPQQSHLIEVRRGNAGTRSWESPQGELYHSSTGASGGLWRHNGFVPQKLVGIGFTAQGWGPGSGYRRLPDSNSPAASFIFEGIGENEVIGDFGLVMGGAVGDEIDRLDFELGTPLHTRWLATSIGVDNRYQLVHEDQLFTSPGQGGEEHPLVRADMTYFDIKGGGAVFSVGSINWAGSMAWNEYNNNVARISDNVLNRFLDK